MRALFVGLLGILVSCAAAKDELISVKDAVTTPQQPADFRYNYGPHVFQFGDLRLPEGLGPHPLLVIIHGGCWTTRFGLHLMDGMAGRLTGLGYATWNIEFRRVGQVGSSWPDLFEDVMDALLYVDDLANWHNLDKKRVILIGHSSGGHLALWLASKMHSGWPGSSVKVTGVVGLAPIVDLVSLAKSNGGACQGSLKPLLEGSYQEVPERYVAASPVNMPFGDIQQLLVSGRRDSIVPPTHVALQQTSRSDNGESTKHIISDSSGHFEMITPGTDAWELVETEIRALVDASATTSNNQVTTQFQRYPLNQ